MCEDNMLNRTHDTKVPLAGPYSFRSHLFCVLMWLTVCVQRVRFKLSFGLLQLID